MKARNLVVKYLGLFALVFTLGLGITILMSGNAAACQYGPCIAEYTECPAGTPCEGQHCFATHIGNTGFDNCCGGITNVLCK